MLCFIVYMLYIGRCCALADVIAMYCCGRWKPQRQMLLPFLYFVADGKPYKLHVTAFEDGRCYCQVADGIATAG